MVVDHNGLFIFIDPGFPGSYHDVTILRQSILLQNWRDFFEHTEEYFEYVLGDPGYAGEDMFIMRRIASREIEPGSEAVINAFNKKHAGLRIRVEWGIGGVKRKWKRLMKRFDSTKPKFSILFRSACLLTNFLHRRRMDMTAAEVDDGAGVGQGWADDF